MALRYFTSCLRRHFTTASKPERTNLFKTYNTRTMPELSDDSDEGVRAEGPVRHPFGEQAPGYDFQLPYLPPSFFYEINGKTKQRVSQPAHLSFPVEMQIWHVFNANVIPLGRMANEIARLLQGKHKPIYRRDRLMPEEMADFVIVVNGKNPMILGNKGRDKIYRTHSTYPGGLRELTIGQVLERPYWDKVVINAVKGMLPSNHLREDFLSRLFVYPDLYHEFENVPQIVLRPGVDDFKELGIYDALDPTKSTILYNTDPNDGNIYCSS